MRSVGSASRTAGAGSRGSSFSLPMSSSSSPSTGTSLPSSSSTTSTPSSPSQPSSSSTFDHDSGLSPEYLAARAALGVTQGRIQALLRDVDAFRRAASEMEAAARGLQQTSGDILRGLRIEDTLGEACLSSVMQVHERMADLIPSAAGAHTEALLSSLQSKVLPSMESAQAAQREMMESLEARNALAKEADSLAHAKKMGAAMRAIHAAGSHRDASAAFARLQADAVTAMGAVEEDLRAAMISSLTQVTTAQATEFGALSQSLRIAANLVRMSAPQAPGVAALGEGSGEGSSSAVNTEDGEGVGLPDDALSAAAVFPARSPAASAASAGKRGGGGGSSAQEVVVAAASALPAETIDYFRSLPVQCLPGEEVLARVDTVRNDVSGDFGLFTVSNYRVRFFGSALFEMSKSTSLEEDDFDLDPLASTFSALRGGVNFPSNSAAAGSTGSGTGGAAASAASAATAAPIHYSSHHHSLHAVVTIPLLAISRFEAVGGPAGSLVIGTSDMRVLSFSFGAAEFDVDSLASLLAPQVWLRIPSFPFKYTYSSPVDGWNIFTPEAEVARLSAAVAGTSVPSRYAVSAINKGFRLCSTYPEALILPEQVPEAIISAGARFRSKQRLAAVCWFRGTLCLARCSQPLTGVFNARSAEDERLLSALVADTDAATYMPENSNGGLSNAAAGGGAASAAVSPPPRQLAIFDARPRLNAIGNAAKGGGTEVMTNYTFATLEYLNIDNIHVVREAMAELRAVLLRQARKSLERTAVARVASLSVGRPVDESGLGVSVASSTSFIGLESLPSDELSAAAFAELAMSDVRSGSVAQPDFDTDTAIGLSFGGEEDLARDNTSGAGVGMSPRLALITRMSSTNEGTQLEDDEDGEEDDDDDDSGVASKELEAARIAAIAAGGGGDANPYGSAPHSASKRSGLAIISSAKMMVRRLAARQRLVGSRKAHVDDAYSSGTVPSTSSAIGSGADAAGSSSGAASSTGADGAQAVSAFSPLALSRIRSGSLRTGGGSGPSSASKGQRNGGGGAMSSSGAGRGPSYPLWIRLVSIQLAGAVRVATKLLSGISVCVHCSDGWDRTSALAALAQLMVDPYYRTLEGACVLMQKEWVAFGHRFARRCGTGGADHFRADAHDSQRSPIFLQFIDCVWQMLRQAPWAFEFNDAFLAVMADAAYSGAYGTFLFDCERDRASNNVATSSVSLWSRILHPAGRGRFVSSAYASPTPQAGGQGQGAAKLVPVIPATAGELLAVWPFWVNKWT